MQLWKDFLTSDVGAMSAIVIGVVVVMGAWYVRYFLSQMHADEKRVQGSSTR